MKQITLENLIADKACQLGLDFVTPIVKAGDDVASEILAAGRFDWFSWLVQKGYDVESARRDWRMWDKKGHLILSGGDFSNLTGGYRSNLTGGDFSTLTGGNGSNLIGGNNSNLTGGDFSNLTGGYRSNLTGGDFSRLIGGNNSNLIGGGDSTLTGGNGSTLTGGNGSRLIGGNNSKLTGGDFSKLTGGNNSKLTGGDFSKLTGGNGSTLIFQHWGRKHTRIIVAYVGENGVEPNVAYKLDADSNVVRAEDEETK